MQREVSVTWVEREEVITTFTQKFLVDVESEDELPGIDAAHDAIRDYADYVTHGTGYVLYTNGTCIDSEVTDREIVSIKGV